MLFGLVLAAALGSSDLEVVGITLSKYPPAVNEAVEATVTVRCRTGSSSATTLRLYDGRPHPIYLYHPLTARKTALLGEVAVPGLPSGGIFRTSFRFPATAELHHLVAWVDPQELLPDADRKNNRASLRFRPEGTTDVEVRCLYVVYRNAFGASLTDDQIGRSEAMVRKWSDFLWYSTLCIRMEVSRLVIDRPIGPSGFRFQSGWGHIIDDETVAKDLLSKGIDLRRQRAYKFIVVNFPSGPTAEWGYGGMGGYRTDWNVGIQSEFLYSTWFNSPWDSAVHIHEGTHGIEGNLVSQGVSDFPPTHIEDRPGYADLYRQLQDDPKGLLRESDFAYDGAAYYLWMYETTPAERWFKLNGNVGWVRHAAEVGLSIRSPGAWEGVRAEGGRLAIKWDERQLPTVQGRAYVYAWNWKLGAGWRYLGNAAPGTQELTWAMPGRDLGWTWFFVGVWDWTRSGWLAADMRAAWIGSGTAAAPTGLSPGGTVDSSPTSLTWISKEPRWHRVRLYRRVGPTWRCETDTFARDPILRRSLIPGTLYRWEVRAWNGSSGWGSWSGDQYVVSSGGKGP